MELTIVKKTGLNKLYDPAFPGNVPLFNPAESYSEGDLMVFAPGQGAAPVDPIQELVNDYKAAATAKGYDYLGDDTVLYEKYEQLVFSGDITLRKWYLNGRFAHIKDVNNVIQKVLSIVKIDGDYPEWLTLSSGAKYDNGKIDFTWTTGTRGLYIPISGLAKKPLQMDLVGELYQYTTNHLYQTTSSPLTFRQQVFGSGLNRLSMQTYSDTDVLTAAASGNDYFVTGEQHYRTRLERSGDTCVVRAYRNNMTTAFWSASRTWNRNLDPESDFILAGFSASVKFVLDDYSFGETV